MKRNWKIFFSFGYCVVIFLYLYLAGEAEDEMLIQRNQQFLEAVRGSGGVEVAIDSLHDLETKLPPTYTIYHALAKKYYSKLDYATAQKYYAKTVQKRPAIVANAEFAFEYASAALRNADFEVAKIYIKQVEKLGIPDGYERNVQQLKKLILDDEKAEE